MGYEFVEMCAAAIVSRHNSERDAHDVQAWNRFVRDVRDLAASDYYRERISIDVVGGDLDYHRGGC